MPAGLAVVPALGDGIEGLLAAHAHGDFLFSNGCRCPLPKIHILERGPGPRSEKATPQPNPASPCPKAWIITGRQQTYLEDLPLSPGSAPTLLLLKASHFYFLGLQFPDFFAALPTEDRF